jgi:hypothetical protein
VIMAMEYSEKHTEGRLKIFVNASNESREIEEEKHEEKIEEEIEEIWMDVNEMPEEKLDSSVAMFKC